LISFKKLIEAKEVKVYLQKGEKAPKGKKVQKGPKGGLYFMGTPEESRASTDKRYAPIHPDGLNKSNVNKADTIRDLKRKLAKLEDKLDTYNFKHYSGPSQFNSKSSFYGDESVVKKYKDNIVKIEKQLYNLSGDDDE